MTKPLTPPDCDLSDFAFMPLDVARLRDSELASSETPEACWAAVLLWAASWHQLPAASIPLEERWIAKTAGYAQRGKIDRAWQQVRAGALRGWIECDDGRLYHPVVAEKAREAWLAKLEQRHRTECARIKKHNDRHHTEIEKPTFEQWLSLGCPVGRALPVPRDKAENGRDTCGDKASKGQGEGQGQGDSGSEANASGAAGAKPAKVTDPDEIIFGYGVPLLTVAGSSDKHARSFLAGVRKHHGDGPLIAALRECIKAKPLQPLEWLAKALPPNGGETVKPMSFAERATKAKEDRFREMAGSAYNSLTSNTIDMEAPNGPTLARIA